MYIAQAFKTRHEWWRYTIGVGIILFGVMIFSLPHLLAISVAQFRGDIDPNKMEDLSYIMGLFDSNLNLVFILLPFAGGLLFLLLVAKYFHKQRIISLTTTRSKIDWNRAGFVFLLWGGISTIMLLSDYFFFGKEADYVLNFKPFPFLILVIISIVLIPLQTSFEEYLFRGYLMQGIGVLAKNRWLPLAITSLVFGLLHIANPEVDQLGYGILAFYIGTGLFLGIITLMDEGMELALGFHAANNFFTAILVTSDWTALQTESILKDVSNPEAISFSEIFLPLCIIYPILLFILSKKYKWTHWRARLFGAVLPPSQN